MLAAASASGPVFAPDHDGGYLELAVPGAAPLHRHAPRSPQRGASTRDYLALFDEPPPFDALDAREHFRYVVLTTANPDRYLGLIAHLASVPRGGSSTPTGSRCCSDADGEGMNLGDPGTVAAMRGGAGPALRRGCPRRAPPPASTWRGS